MQSAFLKQPLAWGRLNLSHTNYSGMEKCNRILLRKGVPASNVIRYALEVIIRCGHRAPLSGCFTSRGRRCRRICQGDRGVLGACSGSITCDENRFAIDDAAKTQASMVALK